MILLKDNEWINVVTVVRFTRRKVEDLSNEHRLLEGRLGKIDFDNFKIVLQARPIDDFDHMVTQLERGYVDIGDLHTKLFVRDPQKTLDQTFGQASHIVRLGEYAEYDCYSVTLSMDESPDRILSKSGISALSLGLRDFNELSRSWLDLESLQSQINIHIIVPIYATAGEIQYQGGNQIKVTPKMDERLLESSNVWLTRKGQGDRAPILERTKYLGASCDNVSQDGFVYITLRHNFSAIGLNDKISVSLVHNELGLLDRKETTVFRFPSETSDPFSQAFALFDAGKKMEKHLLNPNNDEDFVASVSWLLEMIDIRSFKLGRDEIVRENKTEKGSADIIAYDPESNKILVIDCTIGVPSATKIDKIKSTADYISRKITFPVKSVIIAAKKCPAAKDLASKCYVNMVDNTDLERMVGFYKKGHDYPARRVVIDSVGFPSP